MGRWALDENERLEHAYIVFPRSKTPGDTGEHVFLSARSRFGQFLRRASTFPDLTEKPNLEATEAIILDLLDRLRIAGLVARTHEVRGPGDVPGYRVAAAALRWRAGDGEHPVHDPLTTVRRGNVDVEANAFFKHFYIETAAHLGGLEAREHTAQVTTQLREEREERFRDAKLPVLYCSPTMELGVDIAGLNVVNLRNVPPTPANYAQRSGRAGPQRSARAGVHLLQPRQRARPVLLRAPAARWSRGVVEPPRLDLGNEDLMRAHAHSVWLAETAPGPRSLAQRRSRRARPRPAPARESCGRA